MPGLDDGDVRGRDAERPQGRPGAFTRRALHIFTRPVKQPCAYSKNMTSRSRGIICPSFALERAALRSEGAEKTGCLLHPRSRVLFAHSKRCTRAYRYRRSIPAFPAQWLDGLYRALPGERLFCLRRPQEAWPPADLMPAPRHQDHTTSPYAPGASVSHASRVHRIPPHVRDDRERPSMGGTGGVMRVIWGRTKAEYFRFAGLTRFRKIVSDLGVGRFCPSRRRRAAERERLAVFGGDVASRASKASTSPTFFSVVLVRSNRAARTMGGTRAVGRPRHDEGERDTSKALRCRNGGKPDSRSESSLPVFIQRVNFMLGGSDASGSASARTGLRFMEVIS